MAGKCGVGVVNGVPLIGHVRAMFVGRLMALKCDRCSRFCRWDRCDRSAAANGKVGSQSRTIANAALARPNRWRLIASRGAPVVQQPTRVCQSVNASKMRSARPLGPPTRSDAPSHPVHVTPRHSISVARRWLRAGVGPSPTGREQAEMPSNLRSAAVRVGRDKHQSVGIRSAALAARVSVHCGGYGCRSACSWYANRPNRATPTGR
jgi:hypothetical protein